MRILYSSAALATSHYRGKHQHVKLKSGNESLVNMLFRKKNSDPLNNAVVKRRTRVKLNNESETRK